VQWLRGPAEQLPFDDGALDAIVTTSAFHFFDQPAALREFRRVLASGGLVDAVYSSLPSSFRKTSMKLSIAAPASLRAIGWAKVSRSPQQDQNRRVDLCSSFEHVIRRN
jgi:ubiquinone/menaquinone biosynthesis C-methylase UbiE